MRWNAKPFDDLLLTIVRHRETMHQAKSARKRGYDGILFSSYFSQLKSNVVPNLALFGHPIRDGKMKLESINRLHLVEAGYKYSFGPVR